MALKSVLDSSVILIEPSSALKDYLKKLDSSPDMPPGIASFRSKRKSDTKMTKPTPPKILTTKDDLVFIASITKNDSAKYNYNITDSDVPTCDHYLTIADLHWLHEKIKVNNESCSESVYLHELLQDSKIVLPQNHEVPRNPELEARCLKLKAQQDNRKYQAMTKDVDSVRHRYPEDTIAYQMKQINTHLIAIAQFIISVLAGFAFGFIGVDLMVGTLDFGFRLLLGIICALVIALAELYFLAKKLNEDLEYEFNPKKAMNHNTKATKVD